MNPSDAKANNPIRIALMSDLHVEFEAGYWRRIQAARSRGSLRHVDTLRTRKEMQAEPGHPLEGPDLRSLKAHGVDLLLLPGDIHVGTRAIEYADAAARYLECPAFICAGNHEFYHGDLAQLLLALGRAAAQTSGRVTFLERDRVDIAVRGRRITVLGATLWTDYEVNGNAPLGILAAGRALSDHRLIVNGADLFTPEHARQIHFKSRAWLAGEALWSRDQADLVVVMTHHAPIPDANPPHYRGGDLAVAFVSDMRREILSWQPDLWVWGHTHYSMRDQLGRTQLVSAQRGYIGSEAGAASFVPAIVTI